MASKCPKCNADSPDTKQFCGDCGTPLPSSEQIEVTETMETPKEELTTGFTFAGRYQIIEELGREKVFINIKIWCPYSVLFHP